MSEGYEKMFGEWRKSPVMRVNVADIESEADLENIAEQIRDYIAN